MLRQLLLAFGFFALVLVLVYWINRAVLLFDQLIANGQSTMVFAELSILTLPLMIAIVMPIAAFAASIFVTNRLSAENELVVAQSTGFGPFRMARPVLVFGLLTGAFLLVLNHVLVPLSQERLAQRQAEIADNVTARFLTEGTFVHPADGITIYIREISRDGEMRDIFLSDTRSPEQHFVYSAERALIARADSGPRLIMFKGLMQVLQTESDRLIVTAFDDFNYDLSALSSGALLARGSYRYLSTMELLRASPRVLAERNATRIQFLYEAHSRNAAALLSPIAAMIGFASLLLGGFSRFGLWRQIFGAVLILVVLKFLDNTMANAAQQREALVGLVYVPTLIGGALMAFILWLSPRMTLFPPRTRTGGAT